MIIISGHAHFGKRIRLDMRESDPIIAEVEFRVEPTNEHVAEDPERSGRRRNVKADESGEADGLAHLGNLWIKNGFND